MSPPSVALVGAAGHGLWHRRQLRPLHESGRLRLAALCDVAGAQDAEGAPIPAGVRIFADHREMLRVARPDVVIVCTPPHTHLRIAVDAARAGADLLLEKPPVLSLDEHRALAGVLAETGRVCQVGFQALGSAALAELLGAIGAGKLGDVTGVSVAGSWQRSDAYYRRSPWAGRSRLDGRRVLDGALANPFAHALMSCLAILDTALGDAAGSMGMEIERYRTRDIEVDDTACLRLTPRSAPVITAAVTLCGEDFIPGEIAVRGSAGSALLEYPTDRLRLPGGPAHSEPRAVPGRVSLLENLLDHRADPTRVPLVAPLARTAGFTGLLEAIQAAPPPQPIGRQWLDIIDGAITIRGINGAIRGSAEGLALFSELDVDWAVPPHTVRYDRGGATGTGITIGTAGFGAGQHHQGATHTENALQKPG